MPAVLAPSGPRRRVSAAAVARQAGVSAAAVSYVMNDKPGVSAETRQHILDVATRLGFTAPCESDAPGRGNNVVALVQPNIVNPTYPRFAQNIITAGAAAGYEVFIATTQDDPAELERITTSLAARGVQGVILTAALRDDARALRILRAAGIPYVYLSRRSEHVGGDFVGIDDAAAGRTVMRHVLEHGHTEIATVIGPRSSSASLERERAFVATAAEWGVRITGDRKISTQLNSDGGQLAAAHVLAAPDPPRAIVCGSDEMAIGVMEHAVSRGIRIPQDLVVTGCDGTPHNIAGLINLTTIVQPHEDMARTAFDRILHRRAQPSAPYASTIHPFDMHSGRTCGCVG